MTAATGRYAGLSADERRRERRRRLLEAAGELIAEQGPAGLKVRVLCARAGLNDRYFYESFGDTDQLLRELLDEQLAAITAEMLEPLAATPSDTRLRVRAVMETVVAIVADNPLRRRLFLELQTTAELRCRRSELVNTAAAVMLDQGRELLGETAASGLYAELAARTVSFGGLEILTEWLRGDLEIERAQLIDFMCAMILTAGEITGTVQREMIG
ncbi:TetR/AcrR family transcriptional regulator [Nocardia inohanensis]|uniref:TetR/AcrR family transcriptional regulator n=1 Tax=Nocardia inohanensis TaxID=209246 RepID=UPI0008338265|nr:TetR/AcrR family transcriptional regulator [Nocardia inohanensis]